LRALAKNSFRSLGSTGIAPRIQKCGSSLGSQRAKRHKRVDVVAVTDFILWTGLIALAVVGVVALLFRR
jgi:hypothetical protein